MYRKFGRIWTLCFWDMTTRWSHLFTPVTGVGGGVKTKDELRANCHVTIVFDVGADQHATRSCSVGRPTAHAPGSRPARRQRYRRQATTDRQRRQTTDASEQNNTGPLGGSAIHTTDEELQAKTVEPGRSDAIRLL